MDKFISLSYLVGLLALIFFGIRHYVKQKDKFENSAIKKVRSFLKRLDYSPDEYAYYKSVGEIWIKSDINDLEIEAKKTCFKRLIRGLPQYGESQFFLSADESKSEVYFVPNCDDYDISKSMYYSDWLKKDDPVRERIKEFKQNP